MMSNMMDVVCANEKDDFSILDDGEQCLATNRAKIMTCANKALYSLVKRLMDKWIENEHFELETDAEDCKYVKWLQMNRLDKFSHGIFG